jgi:8-oxo-dGTP pyrophosphatase MutT (NUDIX family)
MNRQNSDIEIIARAVIVRGGKILLARRKGAANTFLPGGHVEWGEPARTALRRELWEELGVKLEIGLFLGAVEHAFGRGKERTHEVNLIFRLDARKLGDKVSSRESKLDFFWHRFRDLKAVNLQPRPLQSLLPAMVKNKRPVWASSME